MAFQVDREEEHCLWAAKGEYGSVEQEEDSTGHSPDALGWEVRRAREAEQHILSLEEGELQRQEQLEEVQDSDEIGLFPHQDILWQSGLAACTRSRTGQGNFSPEKMVVERRHRKQESPFKIS